MVAARVTLLFILLASTGSDAAESKVLIGAETLDPPLLQVLSDQRVVFVNHSGRTVHIDFVGDAKQHHIFRVSDEIGATFHRPGRHPYTVHFDDPGGGLLRGVIDVTRAGVSGSPPTCPTLTVMGACLQP